MGGWVWGQRPEEETHSLSLLPFALPCRWNRPWILWCWDSWLALGAPS